MAYKIIVQKPAKEDARDYAAFILSESKSTGAAKRWLDELDNSIQSLAEMPKRYKLIEEQDAFDIPLHQLLYRSHRVIYHVDEITQTIHVLRIYHGARRPLSGDDI